MEVLVWWCGWNDWLSGSCRGADVQPVRAWMKGRKTDRHSFLQYFVNCMVQFFNYSNIEQLCIDSVEQKCAEYNTNVQSTTQNCLCCMYTFKICLKLEYNFIFGLDYEDLSLKFRVPHI